MPKGVQKNDVMKRTFPKIGKFKLLFFVPMLGEAIKTFIEKLHASLRKPHSTAKKLNFTNYKHGIYVLSHLNL